MDSYAAELRYPYRAETAPSPEASTPMLPDSRCRAGHSRRAGGSHGRKTTTRYV